MYKKKWTKLNRRIHKSLPFFALIDLIIDQNDPGINMFAVKSMQTTTIILSLKSGFYTNEIYLQPSLAALS